MSQDHAEDFAVAPEYASMARASPDGAEVNAKAPDAHGADPEREPKEQKPVKVWRAILILIIGAAAVATPGFPGAGKTTRSSNNGPRSRPSRRSRWLRRNTAAKPASSCCRAMSTPFRPPPFMAR